MGSAADLIRWAESQLGVTEDPPDSNHVRYWDDCGQSGNQGQPWCAAFVLAGLELTGTQPTTRSVYVPTIINDYEAAGELYDVSWAEPGDQVLYNIGAGHTGVVLSIDTAAKTVTAIEGNTSSGSSGSQDNGGGVYQRVRPWSTVVGVGHPDFTTTTQEDPVADTDIVAELQVSDRAIYQLERGGSVRVVDVTDSRAPIENEPFHPYHVLANTGQVYTFGPDLGDVFSYPGLDPQYRQGDRYFVSIGPA